jgi:hypothetical protein
MPRQLRSRAFRRLLVATVPLLLSSQALADRASLVLEQRISGQSNLLRTADDEEADGSYQVRPRLRFLRPNGELQYDVEYAPTYDVFFRTDGIDGFDQFGRLGLTYSPSPIGTVRARTELAYYRSIRSNTVDGPTGIPEVVTGVSGRVFRAIADVGYEHELSATTIAEASLGLQSYEYTTPSNVDSFGLGGRVNLIHELRPSIALGGLLFASQRRFDDLGSQPASRNTVLHLGPMLRLQPAPTLSLEVELGPALVLTDRDAGRGATVSRFRAVRSAAGTQAAVFDNCGEVAGQPLLAQCPLADAGAVADLLEGQSVAVDYLAGGRPASTDDEMLTALGRVLLRKDESWGYASLGYFRAEDASSGSGATTVRDSVTATLSLGGESRWGLRLRANWNQRETVDSIETADVVAGESPILVGGGPLSFAEAEALVVVSRNHRKVTQYWGEVMLLRRISKAISVELAARHLQQDRSGTDTANDDFDNWRGSLTIRVELPHLDYAW